MIRHRPSARPVRLSPSFSCVEQAANQPSGVCAVPVGRAPSAGKDDAFWVDKVSDRQTPHTVQLTHISFGVKRGWIAYLQFLDESQRVLAAILDADGEDHKALIL